MNAHALKVFAFASLTTMGSTFGIPANAQTHAAQGTCCWSAGRDNEQALPSKFTATVNSVRKSDEHVVMTPKGKEKVQFKYDSKNGSAEQRQLLDTLKPGDKVRATRMQVDGETKYHFDRAK